MNYLIGVQRLHSAAVMGEVSSVPVFVLTIRSSTEQKFMVPDSAFAGVATATKQGHVPNLQVPLTL